MAVTSPSLAVVRFHGRRTETWEAKGIPVVERFRYHPELPPRKKPTAPASLAPGEATFTSPRSGY